MLSAARSRFTAGKKIPYGMAGAVLVITNKIGLSFDESRIRREKQKAMNYLIFSGLGLLKIFHIRIGGHLVNRRQCVKMICSIPGDII